MKLDGKMAIVTGSNRGLGKVIAIGLAKEGANIVAKGRDRSGRQREVSG